MSDYVDRTEFLEAVSRIDSKLAELEGKIDKIKGKRKEEKTMNEVLGEIGSILSSPEYASVGTETQKITEALSRIQDATSQKDPEVQEGGYMIDKIILQNIQ
jgi:hypothetical protein